MTAKTLTDELRSVLLFHALEAPEPNATVDRILAETVGTVTALGPHDEAPEASGGPRPRRRLSFHHLMAAAVVAVLLISVAGINSARNRNAVRTATEASQDQVSQQRGGAATVNGSRAGSAALPPAADSSLEAKPVAPPAYAGTRLDCSTIPGGELTVGQSDDFKLSSDVEGYLFEYLCVGPNGQRSASEVQMFQLVAGQWRYERSLPHPNAYEHLESMIAGSQAFLQFSVHRPGEVPGEIRAVVMDLAAPADARGYSVAEPCVREQLAVTLTPVVDTAVPSWRLLLRNQGRPDPATGRRIEAACALEGFPRVRAQRAGATLTTAALALNGPAGGVTRQKTPPIIVLTQGATASAVIEQSSLAAAGSCARSDQLAVTLPHGVALDAVPAEVAGCGLVVHPLVGNARGSD